MPGEMSRGESTTEAHEGPRQVGRAWATHVALVLVQIAFASQAVEAKVAMMPRDAGGEGIFPAALAMLRMLGGAVFFQAVVRARGPQTFPISRGDHAKLLGLAVWGIVLNQVFFLFGLRWSTPFSVSLLGATIPVFTAALAVLFRKERFSWGTAAGLALAATGVVSLTGLGALSSQAEIGILLVALNSLSYSAYVVLSRDVVLRLGALRVMAWVFTYGAVLFLPFGVGAMLSELARLTPRGWAYLAYIVAVPTIGAYLLNAWALARSRATVVTIYIVLQPLLAALLARVQLGHAIAPRAALAAVLILAGLALVAFRRPVVTASVR